jgi:hypothetical protein
MYDRRHACTSINLQQVSLNRPKGMAVCILSALIGSDRAGRTTPLTTFFSRITGCDGNKTIVAVHAAVYVTTHTVALILLCQLNKEQSCIGHQQTINQENHRSIIAH